MVHGDMLRWCGDIKAADSCCIRPSRVETRPRSATVSKFSIRALQFAYPSPVGLTGYSVAASAREVTEVVG